MNLRKFALLCHAVILSQVLLAVSMNEENLGHSSLQSGHNIPGASIGNLGNLPLKKRPLHNIYSTNQDPKSPNDPNSYSALSPSNSMLESASKIPSLLGRSNLRSARKTNNQIDIPPKKRFRFTDNTIREDKESTVDRESFATSLTTSINSIGSRLDVPGSGLTTPSDSHDDYKPTSSRLSFAQESSDDDDNNEFSEGSDSDHLNERPSRAGAKSPALSSSRRHVAPPTKASLKNLRILLAGDKMGVSQKTSKQLSSSGLFKRRSKIQNALKYLLHLGGEKVDLDDEKSELAELARATLLNIQETRHEKPIIDLAVISDWVNENLRDNSQFTRALNLEGIVSLINTGKWVNMERPITPSQSLSAVTHRRALAKHSLEAFLKLAPESLTGNYSLALEQVKPGLQEIADELGGDRQYNSLDVIQKWCNKKLPLPRR